MPVYFLESAARARLWPLKWYAVSGGNYISVVAGRFGNVYQVGSTRGLCHKVTPAQTTLTMGFAFSIAQASYSNDGVPWIPLCQLADTAAANAVQVSVWLSPSCQLRVCRGNSSTANVLATSEIGVFNPGAYHYLEFKATINPATGAFECRVDGVNIVSASGVNTQASVNSNADLAWFVRDALGSNLPDPLFYGDMYVASDFLNDIQIESLLPDAAGDATDWDPVGSASNYQCVDEGPPNEDTDLVSTGVIGEKDLYNFGTLTTAAGTVKAVQVGLFARKCDASVRQLRALVKSAATEAQGADRALSLTYGYLLSIWENDPATAAAWLIAAVNALQAGAEARS